ncbi:MAG: rRNA maturation RNase YbeY [Geodermatophilaceae bacterium]|nr:rRNA maturation RNase YbeY [Geodermatophilaceae bacterium]
MNEQENIQVQIEPRWEQQVDAAALQRAIAAVFQAERVPGEAHLSLVIVGDEEMTRLHEAFRADPGTTDVLTFPYEDEGGDEEMAAYLGDIIVCYEQAARQAEEEGHTPQEEMALLAVHGALHLLGYDDEAPEGRAQMWARQRAVMEEIGLGRIAPS